MPSNDFTFSANALARNPKYGTNGQIRIMESPESSSAFGFVVGYQYSGDALTDDYVGYWQQTDSSTNSFEQFDLSAGILKGKSRNTFGPYLVLNEDWNTLRFMGFQTSGSSTTWNNEILTTTGSQPIDLLGAHEVYWWG